MNEPKFIIIGAMRSGTTSLYYNICNHPLVKSAPLKEINFFCTYYSRGMGWYKKQFDDNCVTGEASVRYMPCDNCASRIHKNLPNVKLIALLRNPVDRAYSQYFWHKRYEHHNFEDAVNLQSNREGVRDPFRWNYFENGIYVSQLENYFKLFDKSKIMVISSLTYHNNEWATLQAIFDFLDLPCAGIKHRVYEKQEYPPMKHKTRAWLEEKYKPYNEKLWKLLGREMEW